MLYLSRIVPRYLERRDVIVRVTLRYRGDAGTTAVTHCSALAGFPRLQDTACKGKSLRKRNTL